MNKIERAYIRTNTCKDLEGNYMFRGVRGGKITNMEMFDRIIQGYYGGEWESEYYGEIETYFYDIIISDGDNVILNFDNIDNTKIADGTLYKYICKAKEITLIEKDNKNCRYTWEIKVDK